MQIKMPQAVETIIHTLETHGYEAYAVGGCVRDTLLDRTPEDWDITTSAKPLEIKQIFRKTIDTGIQHGTVTVMIDHVGYEVTTYRIDGEYEDNRHPKQVEFTADLTADLQRRDFTINAMAYNPNTGMVDEFEGVKDLQEKVIRCVGDPGQRFDEDALRMLRAVRFSGQLGFRIDEATLDAIRVRAQNLRNISAERIRVELSKLLIAKEAGRLQEAYRTGMTQYFLPEFDAMMEVAQRNPHHIYTVGEHCLYSVRVMNLFFGLGTVQWQEGELPQPTVQLAQQIAATLDKKTHLALCVTMLLHDVAKPSCMTIDEQGVGHFRGHPQKSAEMARAILRRLTFDNDTLHLVKTLILHHDEQIPPTPKGLRKAAARIGRERMPLLCLVQFADVLAQNPALAEDKLKRIHAVYEQFVKMQQENPPLTVKEMAVTGRDIMEELSMKPGPQIGTILDYLLEQVLESPEKNEREQLLAMAKEKSMKEM